MIFIVVYVFPFLYFDVSIWKRPKDKNVIEHSTEENGMEKEQRQAIPERDWWKKATLRSMKQKQIRFTFFWQFLLTCAVFAYIYAGRQAHILQINVGMKINMELCQFSNK